MIFIRFNCLGMDEFDKIRGFYLIDIAESVIHVI